jgi:nitric oxide reductase NorE protein
VTTDITEPAPTAHAGAEPRRRETRVPGEEGLWVFILGDMTVFALFFGTIVVTRGQQTEVFRSSQHELHASLGIANTLLLLTGSLLVVRGMRALRAGTGRAPQLFAATLVCAIGFASVKATEYVLLVREGHTATDNDFFMYYFVFTGIHLAHLVIGAVIMVLLTLVARKPGLKPSQVSFAECGAVYWHMVDLLWLVLFPLLYLVR